MCFIEIIFDRGARTVYNIPVKSVTGDIMRLDKALSLTGLSRRESKRAIADGRCAVRGKIERDPGFPAELSEITFDGSPLAASEEIYIMLNKPAGVVTAREDSRWGTVMDGLPESVRRRAPGPVGRLDRDVTGLVVLTTDGELAHRLISPKREVEKVYVAQTEGDLSDADIDMLKNGVKFKEYTSKPAKARMIAPETVEITVTEGKFHEVKALLACAGHPVKTLKRVSLGGVVLDENLSEGAFRDLTETEIGKLRRAAGMEQEK